MGTVRAQDYRASRRLLFPVRGAAFHGVVLAISCLISYGLITHILAQAFSVSRDDDLLGGMWAVIATVFVYRFSYEQSLRAAFLRMGSTMVSFVLCLVYLLILPFHAWGMAMLIGIGVIAVTLLGRPEDTVTTGITTAVVMVVAALSPQHAWHQPILRLIDTVVGVAVGVTAARIGVRATSQPPFGRHESHTK